MTTAITVTSSPPYKVTGPLRNLRHASPAVAVTFWPGKRAGGCTSTSVSRPLMVVKFFSPAFTSRQTGALLLLLGLGLSPGCASELHSQRQEKNPHLRHLTGLCVRLRSGRAAAS